MIKRIAVLGAGIMGHGMAGVFAMGGCPVSLYAPSGKGLDLALDRIRTELEDLARADGLPLSEAGAALARIIPCGELSEAVREADYVIEAVPEDLALKRELLGRLDGLCPEHTILASNTSSLPLGEVTALVSEGRRARTMICHWYNPAHLVPLVELSAFGGVSEEVFQEVWALYEGIGKRPVKVLKDIPGLIANRLLHALAREAFSLLEQGAASPEDIDRALKFGPGYRCAASGILEAADMGGLDLWSTVEDALFPVLSQAREASPILREKAASGQLGIKSGQGFYAYPPETRDEIRAAFERRLLKQRGVSQAFEP